MMKAVNAVRSPSGTQSTKRFLTRMHSSRMRTARSSSRRGGDLVLIPLNFPLGVGLDLIPLKFPLGCGPGSDPPQFPPWVWAWRGVSLAGGSPWGGVSFWETSPRGQSSWHTLLKILPCPKLRLRAVIIQTDKIQTDKILKDYSWSIVMHNLTLLINTQIFNFGWALYSTGISVQVHSRIVLTSSLRDLHSSMNSSTFSFETNFRGEIWTLEGHLIGS